MKIIAADGSVHSYNPARITYIADKRPNDPVQRFYIHGLHQGVVPVDGDPAVFIASLPNPSHFAKLTLLAENRSVWVHAAEVSAIHSLNQVLASHHMGANAAVSFGVKQLLVMEDADSATAAVNAAGGSI